MAYDWTTDDEGDTAQLPAGVHSVQIKRIQYGSKGGGPFVSKKGDPQIMVVFSDEEGREAVSMFTLSNGAAWTLRHLLKRFGADVDAMTAQGIEPKHIANASVGDTWLVGLFGAIDVNWPEGSKYPDVEPVRLDAPVVVGAQKKTARNSHVALTDADIPF